MSEFKEIIIKARVLNTKEELANMMKRDKHRNYTEDDLLLVSRFVDTNTFTPWAIYAIKEENTPFSEWLKFTAPMELTAKEMV